MGSPAFAVPALHALADAGHELAAVYCQPPRPANRGKGIVRCAVHDAAAALGLEVRTPASFRRNPEAVRGFVTLGVEAAVVVAYGLILPVAVHKAPERGCLNIHASLLPRWRGAAPVQAALLAGDAETGVTIMRIDDGLDTGPMLLREAVPIGPRTTAPALFEMLASLGAALVLRALAENPQAVPQPAEGATHAAKLSRDDGRLDFTRDAAALDRQVRAMMPWPGTFATFGGEVLKVIEAEPVELQAGDARGGAAGQVLDSGFTVACGSGALRLLRVQRPGRPAVAGDAFLRGVAGWQGLRLG